MDLWTKSQAGESGQAKAAMTVPQNYAIERKWVELIACLQKKLDCANERNISHLQNLVDRNLVLRTVLLRLLMDTLATSKTALTERTKKGLLEQIVKTPFSYMIVWSRTLYWV